MFREARTTVSPAGTPFTTTAGRLMVALVSSSALFSATPIFAQSDDAQATTLAKITIAGQGDRAGTIDKTIVAKSSRSSSKTDTPLLDAPASVSVVTAKEMKERGVTNLDQALAYTPGVSTDIYGSDDRYDHFLIRGFYQTTDGTFRDGLPMRVGGSFTASRLEPYGMERIDVLKGSNSTLFGLSGPGGIVNALTKVPQDKDFGEIYTTVGNGHVETGTDFGGALDKDGIWTYRMTGKWQNANAGIDHTNDDRVYVAPALTWSPDSDTSVTILTDYNKRDGNPGHAIPYKSGIDSETYLGEPDFDRVDTIERNVGYQLRHDFGNGFEFRQDARYTNLDMTYQQIYLGAADPASSRAALAIYGHSKRFQIDNQLQYDGSYGPFESRTLLGADYGRDSNSERRLDGTASGVLDDSKPVYCGTRCISFGAPVDTRTRLTTAGTYLQEQLTIDDRWILTLGGRYDHADTMSESSGIRDNAVDTNFSKRAGLTFKATSELSIYANYSESFQPLAASRSTFLGTPKPQEGTQYEIGAKYRPEGMDALFTLALFDLTQKNVAQWASDYSYQYQVGKVNVKGIEFESKVALTDRLNLTAGYSYWDARIKDDATTGLIGNRPELVPNHMATLWADYTIPGKGAIGDINVGMGARFVGKTFGDNANTLPLASRTVFDAAFNYKFKNGVALAVNATNIFDKEYVASIDDYSLAAYYGDRRAVRATLRYTW
ncbi:TonB-dependent siderophore receptor [Rhizobium sp. L58/93]|uniref:TonB-dependent siderophore receptor n=2 Tax=Rhizobium TaxID=379 RepID=UPI001FFE1E9C|nr:TonB-dependent siderophore receptor [Rhizobium sp. L58/93]